MSHLEERLQRDLDEIRSELVNQSEVVQIAIKNAIRAVQTGDHELAYSTVLNDHPINRHMRRIDRLCHSFIAVHLPSAGPLRQLSSAMRVNVELERIGDYAVTISREALRLGSLLEGEFAHAFDQLCDQALLMLDQAISAFNELNAEKARSTMPLVGPVESTLNDIYMELMHGGENGELKQRFALFVIFAHLKRVMDQAKNLCEETVFAVTGEQKAAKVYNILFVSSDSRLSRIAYAVAHKNHFNTCNLICAGSTLADLDAETTEFLLQSGAAPSPEGARSLTSIPAHVLAQQHVLISLDQPPESYFDEIPFHSVALRWDVTESSAAGIEELYRDIALRMRDLMQLIRGDE
jgi:phosphate transport system protein